MALAILGIVMSLVGPIIEIGKCVASPIKRQLTYLCCLDSNIQSLRDEARNLKSKRDALQIEIAAAENNAKSIIQDVKTWIENANKKIEAYENEIDCEISNFKNGCWDIKSRYRFSRKVSKVTREMKQLVEDRNKFVLIASSPPRAAHVPIPLGETYEFQSRKHIKKEIMEALRANEIRTMGICGMGGVGKTTMAKQIMNRVKDKNIFQEIPMAVVSQQVDMLKIQDAIAESLGLKFEEKTLLPRATKLRARLTGSAAKRILVVLDDVWETLKLDELGIPSGNEWCTILLTSRNRDVLNKMDVQKICAMEVLSNDEAWILFREKAGICEDDNNLSSIAQNVAKECKGLPIALITVGGALKGQTTITSWKGALDQLKSSNPEYMPDFIKDVYNPLKLSYTYLERHAQSLFLLCSLFPEDANISLENVALYCYGSRMFYNSDFASTSEGTLGIVRNRIFTTIGMLRNRFLLLKGRNQYSVRVHDVVRDVAIYIAKNESKEGMVDVKLNSLRSSREYSYGCVSVISGKLSSLSMLQGSSENNKFEIEDSSLFEETRDLHVLSFVNVSLKSLPLEIQLLKSLRTLVLESCKLESLSVVGEVLSLEILRCHNCFGIKELPVEIGKLNQLKLLEFSDSYISRIPPGVISNLIELEEFKMLRSFGGWGSTAVVEGQERRNASLNEFECLSKLTCLEIQINNFNLAAEEINFSPNIVNYHIQIGFDVNVLPLGSLYERRAIAVKFGLGREIKLGSWVLRYLRNANHLYLEGDYSNSLHPHTMKIFKYRHLSTDKKLVNPSQVDVRFLEIFDGEVLDSSNSFQNLEYLWLLNMRSLKHICKRPDRSVVSLDKLHEMWIRNCSNLVNLFSFTMDGQNDSASIDDLLCIQNVHYPKLHRLEFAELR